MYYILRLRCRAEWLGARFALRISAGFYSLLIHIREFENLQAVDLYSLIIIELLMSHFDVDNQNGAQRLHLLTFQYSIKGELNVCLSTKFTETRVKPFAPTNIMHNEVRILIRSHCFRDNLCLCGYPCWRTVCASFFPFYR